MATIQELRAAIQARKEAYQAIVDTGTRAEIRAANEATKAAQAALIDALIVGAKPCPTSGLPPTALIQEDERFGEMVEIGSRVAAHYRARGIDQESAVKRWNEGVDELVKRRDALPESERSKPLVALVDGKLVGVPPTWFCPKKYR